MPETPSQDGALFRTSAPVTLLPVSQEAGAGNEEQPASEGAAAMQGCSMIRSGLCYHLEPMGGSPMPHTCVCLQAQQRLEQVWLCTQSE